MRSVINIPIIPGYQCSCVFSYGNPGGKLPVPEYRKRLYYLLDRLSKDVIRERNILLLFSL
jgi:hypothetical protein